MKRSCVILITGCFITLCLAASQALCQKLVATVNVNTEKLIQESREKLANLSSELERYINDYDWTDNEYRYEIPLQVDVFFERAQPTSFEDRYDAVIVLSNATDFQASDRRWAFTYMQGSQFTHSGQFHPLTGMLDFYIYILLGQEYDKLAKLGGTEYYKKASKIVQLSKFSEFYQSGWKERESHIQQILSDERVPLRELEYFFVQAKQWMRLDNRKTAGQYLRVILIRLRKINPELKELNRFYQLHHLDMARWLSLLGMRQELEELSRLNPDNAVTYRQFIEQIP